VARRNGSHDSCRCKPAVLNMRKLRPSVESKVAVAIGVPWCGCRSTFANPSRFRQGYVSAASYCTWSFWKPRFRRAQHRNHSSTPRQQEDTVYAAQTSLHSHPRLTQRLRTSTPPQIFKGRKLSRPSSPDPSTPSSIQLAPPTKLLRACFEPQSTPLPCASRRAPKKPQTSHCSHDVCRGVQVAEFQ